MLHSLVIGVGEHRDSQRITRLSCARRDAEAFAAALRERAFGPVDVTLLVDEAATKANVERALTDELPRRVTPADSFLLYFAGYGAPDIDAQTGDPSVHLVLHDTSYAELFATAINVESELCAWLRRLPSDLVGVVLDASFNGAEGGRSFEGPGLWSGPRLRRLERASCARLAFGRRCSVLTACTEKELAREDEALGHGAFTHHLVDVLRRPTATRTPVSLERLHALTLAAMRARGVPQSPALHGTAPREALFEVRGREEVAVRASI